MQLQLQCQLQLDKEGCEGVLIKRGALLDASAWTKGTSTSAQPSTV